MVETMGSGLAAADLDVDGRLDLDESGAPGGQPKGLTPWFASRSRRSSGEAIVFGHWAALGHRMGPGYIALDSGCVWGGPLTAVRLEDRAVFQVSNAG